MNSQIRLFHITLKLVYNTEFNKRIAVVLGAVVTHACSCSQSVFLHFLPPPLNNVGT